MPTNAELTAEAERTYLRNYRQPPIVMTRGLGCRIWDVEDREYLDFSGGIAVESVGHSHPTFVAAITAQVARLTHTSNLFYSDRAIELARELTRRTGFERVYFANSGTEANEALIKLGRRYFYEQGDKERVELVSTHHSFHGRTMGALTLTGQPKYHAGMGPLLGGVSHIAYGDLDAMRAAVGPRTAAVFLEPIQAEGGIIVPSDAYLRGVREICDAAGALLFFDEVQTGFGRTGRFLGREWSGVMPDACSLAKGIGGGFPLAAMMLREKLAAALPVGAHGSTYGGGPLACAAGLAVLRIFDDEKLVENAHAMGEHLRASFERLVADATIPAAAEARGRGLLQGVRIADGYDALAALAALRSEGVLASLAGGTVLRFAPALVVTRAEIDRGVAALETALRALAPAS